MNEKKLIEALQLTVLHCNKLLEATPDPMHKQFIFGYMAAFQHITESIKNQNFNVINNINNELQ